MRTNGSIYATDNDENSTDVERPNQWPNGAHPVSQAASCFHVKSKDDEHEDTE